MDSRHPTAADRPGHGRVGGVDDPVARADYGDDREAVREAQRDAAGECTDARQHASVYLLDDAGERPREIRHDPSAADLIEHYDLAGEEEVVDLSDVWERWNRGSGRESQAFVEAETRSLSVGDVVVLDGDAFRCDRIGWTSVAIREGESTPD
jgi:hypothetical protein